MGQYMEGHRTGMQGTLSMSLSSSMRSAGLNFRGGASSGEEVGFAFSSSDIAGNAARFWTDAQTKLVRRCCRMGRLPEVALTRASLQVNLAYYQKHFMLVSCPATVSYLSDVTLTVWLHVEFRESVVCALIGLPHQIIFNRHPRMR